MQNGEYLWQQTVAAHCEEYTRLSHEVDKNNGNISDQNCQNNCRTQPGIRRFLNGNRDRCGAVFKLGVIGQTCHHISEQDKQNRTDNQRSDDPDGHISLWILRLLSHRCHNIESDKNKKDYTCAPKDSADAKLTKHPSVLRNIRMVICRIDVLPAKTDKYQNDTYFQNNNNGIK